MQPSLAIPHLMHAMLLQAQLHQRQVALQVPQQTQMDRLYTISPRLRCDPASL